MKTSFILMLALSSASAQWPEAKAPAIREADGYVAIPSATLSPNKDTKYRAVYDATHPASKATELVPAINMAASELNALAVAQVALSNAKFALVFHGAAVDGILDSEHYKAKFGTENPNLKVISEMKKAGVEFFVCGQYLAA